MSTRAFTQARSGRTLLRVAAQRFADIPELIDGIPGRFVFFVAADTLDIVREQLVDVSEEVLRRGAAAVHCWGHGAARLEHCFDEAAMRVFNETDPVILTSSSEDGDLEDAIWEGVMATFPAEGLNDGYERVVLAIVGSPAMIAQADAYLEAGVPLRDEA